MTSQRIVLGDCLDVFANERNIEAFVSDPPGHVGKSGFMGRKWDRGYIVDDFTLQLPARSREHENELRREEGFIRYWATRYAMGYDIADQHAVSIIWTLPRTSYQTATALRRAGWTIKDNLVHLFGTGWAKTGNALAPGQEGWLLATKGKPDINIDACRVPRGGDISNDRKSKGDVRSGRAAVYGDAIGERGEWKAGNGSLPKNALLSHCEECVRVGVKQVGSGAVRTSGVRNVHAHNKSASRGTSNGTQFAPDTYGTESVPAWHCLAGCVCGARSVWDPEKQLPRCPCGETWRWICAVAEVNGQSGNLETSGTAKLAKLIHHKPTGNETAYGARTESLGRGYSESGGASRFFNTFSHLSMANVPNDGTMSATRGGDSWNESANHAVCDLCRSVRNNDSADIAAQGVVSQRNSDKSDASTSIANNAGNGSKNSQGTVARIARENAPDLQDELSDQSASTAENHARECVTNSAPSDAPISLGQESSRHGLDSTGMHSERTPSQCRVCGVVLPENIVTTTTTQSHETSNGFAPSATSTSITWVSQEEREYARTSLPSYKYLSKCSSSERHAGCENLYWRTNKKNPFGFDHVTREEWGGLPVDQRAHGNVHPTVKSYRLVHWFHMLSGARKIRDYTAGSGTGLFTAYLDGIDWLGAEICPEAVVIANARLAFWKSLTSESIAAFLENKPMKQIMKIQEKTR